MKKTELAIGDSAPVELIFTARHFKGHVNKSAVVTTNDSTAKSTRVAFSAFVVPDPDTTLPVELSLRILDFTPQEGKKFKDQEKIKIRNIGKETIQMRVMDYPEEYIRIKPVENKINPKDDGELKIKLKREATEGTFEKTITIELEKKNSKEKSRFSVPVRMLKPTAPEKKTAKSSS